MRPALTNTSDNGMTPAKMIGRSNSGVKAATNKTTEKCANEEMNQRDFEKRCCDVDRPVRDEWSESEGKYVDEHVVLVA